MKNSFDNIIHSEKPVLIDFFATWCGPCQMLAPILVEVKNEMGEAVSVIKIDVDKNQEIAGKLGVRGVPTLLLYKAGNLLWRQSGVVSKQELVSLLQQHI